MDESLKKIVLLMVCLAVLGCIIAGVHYVAIDLPLQAALHTPRNGMMDIWF